MSKPITSTQFLAQLPKHKLRSAYLVIGVDGYLIDKVSRAVKDVVKKIMPDVEILTIYGDELSVSETGEYLDSYSIFSDSRLLVIRNAHQLKNKDAVINYLKDPEASQVLLLIADAVDGRLAVWKAIKELCVTIECEAIKYAGEMRNWLESALKQNRKTMEDKAKSLFLEKVELDFCTAENEMEKLLVFVGERPKLTENDVKTALPTTRVGTLTDFFKALGNRQTGEVLAKVNDMLENEWADLQILSTIYRFFLTIWKIHALKAKHISEREITATHLNDLFQTQRDNYLAYAKQYSPDELPHIFQVILDTDAKIKLSMAESNILMTLCVTDICHEH
jgi:DNA polymerase-3 subunit delta